MNEKTIQIIPAPSNLMYAYDGGTAQPVACLALVELADGDRDQSDGPDERRDFRGAARSNPFL